jgi:serine/threonine protein kinase
VTYDPTLRPPTRNPSLHSLPWLTFTLSCGIQWESSLKINRGGYTTHKTLAKKGLGQAPLLPFVPLLEFNRALAISRYETDCIWLEIPMTELSTYTLESLRKTAEFVLYRGQREAEPRHVLVLAPLSKKPAQWILRRLENEYEFRVKLDPAWAVLPLALVRHKERTMLVLEDLGGEPLDRILDGPLELARLLRIAVGLTAALGRLHEHGLIHKDIKPANVIVDRTSGKVWLTGFGIASGLPRERQAPEPPETIAGTLRTWRPNRPAA